METIINPVDRQLLLKELNDQRFIRTTNYGNNEIYIINHHNSPHTMREIGRLREVSFRAAGGGTGKACDLDEFDTDTLCYEQLLVWNPEEQEIVGGYRFILMKNAKQENGEYAVASTELFKFSDTFLTKYLPYAIELGRSFVQPKFQPSLDNRKGMFSLDNLWDGLGALVVDYPEIKYFFGKVTMYMDFNQQARDYILSFMNYFFPDSEHLVCPHQPLPLFTDVSNFLDQIKELDYKEAHRILNQHVRDLGENIPPLVNAYMNLSATMKTFGTAPNHHFGEVEETGILVTIADIYDSKKERHLSTYSKT
jgi:putative hemolysin